MASPKPANTVRLLLTGDVMLGKPSSDPEVPAPAPAPQQTPALPPCRVPGSGRGVDQALPCHCSPELYEGAVRDARCYTQLAVAASGPLPQQRPPDYVWGVALADMEVQRLAGRIPRDDWEFLYAQPDQ